MSKTKVILSLGVWISILPYLGFPYYIKNILFTLSGLAILFFGYLQYKELGQKKKVFDNFSENRDFIEENEEVY